VRARLLRFAFLLLACLGSASLLAQAPTLYTGEAAVADQSDGQRAEGMKAALSQVVVKLTGDSNVLTRESVAKGLAEAERYVQQYSYRQDVVTEAGQPQVKLTLVAQFDRGAVDRLLRDYGLKAVGGPRPPLLTFVAIDDGSGARLVDDGAGNEGRALLQAAQQRGVNLVLPALADADQSALAAQVAWNGDVAALAPLAAKLQTSLVLVGQVRRLGAQWAARWTLGDGSAPQSWDASGDSLDDVLAAGAGGAAERVAGRYAAPVLERRASTATVWIGGLASADDYARLLATLGRDDLVREAQPVSARADGVLVKLSLNVTLESWLANLGIDGPLRTVSTRPPLDGVEATLAFVR
jgi:hypothetical protein